MNDIASTYEFNKDHYRALKDEIIYEIQHALHASAIKYHSVVARVKELESLLSKVESKQIVNPFTEVPDIVGARIVALFLSDIERVVEVLRNTFDVFLVDNKIDDADPRLFGYFSIHIHARIKATFIGTRYDKIKNIPFEVQIRTIAMDAWAAASHYLDYKSEADVPADLKRDFNALSGLYYVADKHFEMFYRSREANLQRIGGAFKNDYYSQNKPFDLDTLSAFLRDKFSDREQPDASDASALLAELRNSKTDTAEKIKKRIEAYFGQFLEDEREHPPRNEFESWKVERFTATGVVRGLVRNYPEVQ